MHSPRLSPLTAPSAPLSVTANNASSTSISVSWSPPSIRRGTITSYTITYYITGDGPSSSAIVVEDDGSATSTVIEDLMKYTNYTVFVQASTSVGIGDSSDMVTVFTDEDGERCNLYMIVVHYLKVAIFVGTKV